jgi:hypothetical protein
MAQEKAGSSSGSRKTKGTGSAKKASGTAARKRGSGKRDVVKTPTGKFFAHRDGEGKFREMDEVGRSLAADRRQKAKTKVASGHGDRGDR